MRPGPCAAETCNRGPGKDWGGSPAAREDQEAHLGAEAEVVPEEVSCQASSFGSRTRLAGVRAECCRVGAQPPPGSARPAEEGPCHHQAGRRRGPTWVRKSPECERRMFKMPTCGALERAGLPPLGPPPAACVGRQSCLGLCPACL